MMASPAKTSLERLHRIEEPPLKRAPTLYTIILFKLVKGGLFLFFGVALFFQATHNLPKEWSDFLARPTVVQIFHKLRIHPENRLFTHIAAQIADSTPQRIRWTACGTALWSLFPLTEGIGLLFRVPWAGWLAIGESAFFVPLEIFDMAREYSNYMLLIAVVNSLIVWYLFANRETLFHHHYRLREGN